MLRNGIFFKIIQILFEKFDPDNLLAQGFYCTNFLQLYHTCFVRLCGSDRLGPNILKLSESLTTLVNNLAQYGVLNCKIHLKTIFEEN